MDLAAIQRRLEIEQLYTAYAHCLDDDRLEEWPEFFTEDCAYRVTSAENYEAGLPLGIIYATSKNMLVDRVMALRKANIYEPQRYRHLIACLRIDGNAGVSPAGRYLDRIVRRASGWKFARKEVVLDSRRIDTLLAIPL